VASASIFTGFTNRDPFLPFNYQSLRVYKPFTARTYALIDVVAEPKEGDKMAVFDISIYNEDGQLALKVEHYALVNVAQNQMGKSNDTSNNASEQEKLYILPKEGVDIFDRILQAGAGTNILVSPYNLMKTIHDVKDDEDNNDDQEDTEDVALYERPELSTDYTEPTNEVEKIIANIWGQILGIGQIGINDNFNELGGNSLLVVQAVSNISGAFNIQLPVDIFKGEVTVKSISEYVMELLVQDIDEDELDKLLNEVSE
jgi:acyl carrier protein